DRGAQGSGAPLHRGPDRSDDRRSHRVVRDARRRPARRAWSAHRLRRAARDRADHPRETARRLPARRISARARDDRHGRLARRAQRGAGEADLVSRAGDERGRLMADFARSAHPLVQAQLDRLPALAPPGDRLGLERIAALLERLGRPQDRLPPVFHIAGTNGKGSTVAFLRAALEASGYKIHAFTSPHLVRFNERIRVAGRLIDDETLSGLLTEVLDAGAGIEPSFFEVATAAALLAFARTAADACILEVGLGGRLDATNVIEQPLVTGIANLALDHQQFLGRGLAGIAGEKAAIAKRGVPLVTQLY